ncbi:MAG: hypothetical protein WC928_00505 [Patescibacteria group bacterium]|jgi:hypothetical protein
MKIKKNKKESDLVFKKHKIKKTEEEKKNSLKNLKKEEIKVEKLEEDNIGLDYEEKLKSELTEKEIESNLLEIYSDEGNMPDFKTIQIKKKRGFLHFFVYFLIFSVFLGSLFYFVFNYIKNNRNVSSVLEIKVSAPSRVVWGEDFVYEIEYRNSSNYTLNNIKLEVSYPENFVLAEIYSIDSFSDNKVWELESLGAKISGKIKIRGKIINKEGSNNLLSVKSSYEISGLSSHFSKESLCSVVVGSLPFQINDEYFSTILAGEEYPLKLSFKDFPFEEIDEVIISFNTSSDVFSILADPVVSEEPANFEIEKIDDVNFKIKLLSNNIDNIIFKYKISQKTSDQESFSWRLKYVDENEKEFSFFEKEYQLEIIKSDLHLNISVNDSSNDKPVNFGDKLNYVISYSNKGDKKMKDLVIMAVLDSAFLDWNKVDDPFGGNVGRKTISWSFRELSELKELDPGQSGEIRFSINVADFKKIEFGQNLEVKSYAQFSIGNLEDFSDESERLTDNRSNTISNKINSNLSIDEAVLYFNEDNIPVGSGPLPPVVGEKTTFKYYWTLKNSLHELRDVKVELDLPDYIFWENDFLVSAGNLSFDPLENRVVWTISRWPLGIDKIEANFAIGIVPGDSEYNKIIILSSGSTLEAVDVETEDRIVKKTGAKTSKLEDDDIAVFSNDGRVR